MKNDEQEE